MPMVSRNHEEFEQPQTLSGDPEFQALRRVRRRTGLRLTLVAVGGFLLYVLLSSFTPGLMNSSVAGYLTLGLALGLGQFVLMAVVARRHVVHMRTHVDPVVRGLGYRLRRPPGENRQRPTGPTTAHRTQGQRTW